MTTRLYKGYAQIDPTILIFYAAQRECSERTSEWRTRRLPDKLSVSHNISRTHIDKQTHTHTPHVCLESRGGGGCGLCLGVYLRVMKTLQLLHWKLILKTETELARCRLLLVRELDRERERGGRVCVCVCMSGGAWGVAVASTLYNIN